MPRFPKVPRLSRADPRRSDRVAEGGAVFGGRAGLARASVFRRCLGYPARTRGEVAEWLKAAPC